TDYLKDLQKDMTTKIGEYRKHNYTDISKLQSDLNKEINNVQKIIASYEENHNAEIQLNIDFLENDKVKGFIDLLHNQGNIGKKIPFSKKLLLLQEGQIRYDNLIPPGFCDSAKVGEAKYGDLFVWKDIITIANEKNTNIIFVCNDTKEDWWEKNKDIPIDLRQELNEEFKETNPSLSIHFLTLDKFFSYLSEELKLGKSKSALQLSALDDTKEMLANYEDKISQSIKDYLITINIEKELDEEFLETGDENIYWSIADVSVEKENKNITYYVNLDISVLADLVYQEDGDYPYDAGKIALALIEEIEISMEEYSIDIEIKTISVEKSDILHIEPEVWSIVKHMENQNPCKEIIAASKNVTKIQENAEQLNNTVDMNSLKQTLQQYATLYEGLAQSIKPIKTNEVFTELTKQTAATQKALSAAIMPLQANGAFSELAKQAAIYQSAFSAVKPLQANSAFSELAKQASLYQSAFSAIKPLQANSAFSELAKQFSANKKMSESTDDPE
ncbi:MAG: hypothetical protein K2M60_11775, partial [Lachnospiraceae bacterium]|nr:hypothetical protein [Lachnospiraceae bacterium]